MRAYAAAVLAALFSTSLAGCVKNITCPCGASNTLQRFCLDDIEHTADTCAIWVNCTTCQSNLNECLACPKGSNCSTNDTSSGIFRQKRQMYQRNPWRRKRGHGDGSQCGLEMNSAGSYNCTISMEGTSCDVTCHGFPGRSNRYFCYPGNGWNPRLPHCVRDKGGASNLIRISRANNVYSRQSGTRWRVCSDLQSPKSGSITCQTFGRERQCTGSCLPGYSFEGNTETEIILRCDGGTWTPMNAFPKCKSDGQCDLEMNGAGAYNCTSSMQGTACDIMCHAPSNRYNRYSCYPGNGWDPPLPHCVREKYGSPSRTQQQAPQCRCQNGGVCNRNGSCTCRTSSFTGRYCHIAVAIRRGCPDPGFVSDGIRMNGDGRRSSVAENFEEGSYVVFTCNSGYSLQGSGVLTCLSSGTWSQRLPTCETTTTTTRRPITCRDPGLVANADRVNTAGSRSSRVQTYQEGESVAFTCRAGYALLGSSLLTCQSSGRWSSRLPSCRRIPSHPGRPPVIVTTPSTTTTTENVDIITYCYSPDPVQNGRWTATSPIGGTFSSDDQEYPEATRLRFSCDAGYQLVGQETITCEASGLWSEDQPSCTRNRENLVVCSDPGVDPNGDRNYDPWLDPGNKIPPGSFPQGTRLYYSCKVGYTLQGQAMIYCTNTGGWSRARPTCQLSARNRPPQDEPSDDDDENVDGVVEEDEDITYCESPDPISNGRRTVIPSIEERLKPKSDDESSFPETTRLRYTCDEEYALVGRQIITCEQTGMWSHETPYCVKDCGRSLLQTTRRVTHGTATVAGEWPWTVAIANISDGYSKLVCGGSLLDSRTVLTAAHCLMNPTLEPTRNIRLYFGKYHRDDVLDDNKVQIRTPVSFVVHPQYNRTTMDNDIAIIRFSPVIKYSVRIQPVCMPTEQTSRMNIVQSRKGYVLGWGDTEHNRASDELLMAHIPVVPGPLCKKTYEEQNIRMPITDNMFCAGFDQGRAGACSGDSGGPLVFFDEETDRHTIEGVVSFGNRGGCALPKRYTVFTKVSNYLRWIRDAMRSS